jgi:hypothetical protein
MKIPKRLVGLCCGGEGGINPGSEQQASEEVLCSSSASEKVVNTPAYVPVRGRLDHSLPLADSVRDSLRVDHRQQANADIRTHSGVGEQQRGCGVFAGVPAETRVSQRTTYSESCRVRRDFWSTPPAAHTHIHEVREREIVYTLYRHKAYTHTHSLTHSHSLSLTHSRTLTHSHTH